MNKVISILMLVLVVISGLSSYHLFRQFDYNVSALLTITSYASIVLCIYALSVRNGRTSLK